MRPPMTATLLESVRSRLKCVSSGFSGGRRVFFLVPGQFVSFTGRSAVAHYARVLDGVAAGW